MSGAIPPPPIPTFLPATTFRPHSDCILFSQLCLWRNARCARQNPAQGGQKLGSTLIYAAVHFNEQTPPVQMTMFHLPDLRARSFGSRMWKLRERSDVRVV